MSEAQICKRADFSGFGKLQRVAKYKKIERDFLETLKNFQKIFLMKFLNGVTVPNYVKGEIP